MSRPSLLFTASKSDYKHLRYKFWVGHCSAKLNELDKLDKLDELDELEELDELDELDE